MSLKKLATYLEQDTLTVEQHIDALQILSDTQIALAGKEIVVEEPADIDDEVAMVWTMTQLNRLREADVVAIANNMGLDASVRDKKADTIAKILEAQG